MPANPQDRMPGPLDSLPRPLADRERRGRGRRRLTALVVVALVVAIGGLGIQAIAQPSESSGQVADTATTPEPTAASPNAVVQPAAPSLTPATSPAPARIAAGEPTIAPPVAEVAAPPDPATLTGYRWPLPHGRLTLPFGPSPWGSRIVEGELFHDGIDLATFCGDRVVAAHDGTVLASGRHYDKLMGWDGDLEPYFKRLDKKKLWSTLPIVLVMDDGNGYRSVYAHFGKVVVKKGEAVKAGQLIGYEGATGRASGCHVHFGLFSPQETARFGIDPAVVKRMKVPKWVIARIDPLLVLPERR